MAFVGGCSGIHSSGTRRGRSHELGQWTGARCTRPKVAQIVRVRMIAKVLGDELLALSVENVETVLDEVRPFLLADGGNCQIHEIDGATVKLLLEGACVSCVSSAVTMTMGIEKRLKERIPQIQAVVQVLDEVRPFLSVARGSIHLQSITGVDGPQPIIRLSMTGAGAAIMSVKMEITQRLRRKFPSVGQIILK